MSAVRNPETGEWEVYSSLHGGMVPTGKPLTPRSEPGVDYCGYCKHGYDENGNCACDGHGGYKGGDEGTCIYCNNAIVNGRCACDE